jgi:hypothetical protein
MHKFKRNIVGIKIINILKISRVKNIIKDDSLIVVLILKVVLVQMALLALILRLLKS